MDVIVVDEEHRQPIQRPSLTVVIDVYSRMVLGFAIYLEKPSAFTAGLAIAHAVLPKEHWLADVGVQAEWPCWGKMRTIHCDNAKEPRGRSRSQSYSQIALLHSHLFLHDQLTFADISGTDIYVQDSWLDSQCSISNRKASCAAS
jgi:putative transposase